MLKKVRLENILWDFEFKMRVHELQLAAVHRTDKMLGDSKNTSI